MTTTRIPSVLDTYFQHKVLTKVVGQPTYESLQLLSTEIKANASSVPSTLGGGLYGHLGLILSDERYATLAHSVPWVTPQNPGPFDPPNPATAAQIEAAKDVWRERKLTFELCQATEKALIAQIVDSIDSIYLRALLNRVTGQYSNSISAVLAHLFTTHGKITPQQVKATEMAVYSMHYSILLPVDTVFNSIDDLADLAGHANSPLTSQQMIDLAFVLLSKEPILQQDLRLWNRKPIQERTWPNMIMHFCEASPHSRRCFPSATCTPCQLCYHHCRSCNPASTRRLSSTNKREYCCCTSYQCSQCRCPTARSVYYIPQNRSPVPDAGDDVELQVRQQRQPQHS